MATTRVDGPGCLRRGDGRVPRPRRDVQHRLTAAQGSELHQARSPGDKGSQGWAVVSFRYHIEATSEGLPVASFYGLTSHVETPPLASTPAKLQSQQRRPLPRC
jgi:hypothetical protein